MRQKTYNPKPGDPGTSVTVDGREYIIWSKAPYPMTFWAMPAEPRGDDAAIYQISLRKGVASPHHADGSECRPYVWHEQPTPAQRGMWQGPGLDVRQEEPCRHKSHKKELTR